VITEAHIEVGARGTHRGGRQIYNACTDSPQNKLSQP